jgi:N-acetylglucosamine-6-phosphate deacetylase
VDVGEPDEEEEELEDVLPDAALVVDAVVLAPELDAVVLADAAVDVVVPLVPSPATAARVVDCICMVLEFNVKLRDAAARGQSA